MAGYSIPRHERVIIYPTPPVNLWWTPVLPSISVGIVQDLVAPADMAPSSSGGNSAASNVDITGPVGTSKVRAMGHVEPT